MSSEDEEILQEFVTEAKEHLSTFEEDVLRIEQEVPTGGAPGEVVNRAFRAMHTIKGTAAFFGLTAVVKLAHSLEATLGQLRENPASCPQGLAGALLRGADLLGELLSDPEGHDEAAVGAEIARIEQALTAPEQAPTEAEEDLPTSVRAKGQDTVRLHVSLLDSLVNLAGELVLARNRVMLTRGEDTRALQSLDRVTTALQDAVMRTRMRPLEQLFERFPRVVRDLARRLDKKVNLRIHGGAVELDRSILEALSDPLVHGLRNAIDHGLEPAEIRAEFGKPEEGVVTIQARQESGHVVIEISDDGKGIDPEMVRDTAVARGLISRHEARKVDDRDVLDFLFYPSFSTADRVTEISGRGVGMDVVRAAIEGLRGDVELQSTMGRGTTMRIRVPLTLAIVPALLVQAQDEAFVIPEASIMELVRVAPGDPDLRVEDLNGADVLWRRGEMLPVVNLAEVLEMPPRRMDPDTGQWVEERRQRLADQRRVEVEPVQEEHLPERRSGWLHIVVLRTGLHRFGLVVDGVGDIQETVIKPPPPHLRNCRYYGGATILADGTVALVLDPVGIAARARLRMSELEREEALRRREPAARAQPDQRILLLFRYGGSENFAVPAEMISRIDLVTEGSIVRTGRQRFLKRSGKVVPLIEPADVLPVGGVVPDEQVQYALICRGGRVGAIPATEIDDSVSTSLPVDRAALRGPGITGTVVLEDRMAILLDPDTLLEAAGIVVDETADPQPR